MMILVQPSCTSKSTMRFRREGRPPGTFRVAIERKKTSSPASTDAIRIRSPSRAPPVIGEDGSTARIATFSPKSNQCETIRSTKQDFPTPGEPVTPRTHQGSNDLVGAVIESAEDRARASSRRSMFRPPILREILPSE